LYLNFKVLIIFCVTLFDAGKLAWLQTGLKKLDWGELEMLNDEL